MDDKHVCPICGEPTYKYFGNYRKDGLCTKHGLQANAGEIILCEKCGKWHESNKECNLNEETKNELICLTCNNPSNGYHFCKECWNKYKDRAVDLRITNCTTVEILDGYGNRKYKAKSGVRVRSFPEKVILDHLWDKNIRVIYEKEIEYTDQKTDKEIELHPDFTLPDYKDLIIEYNGMTTSKYLATKQETKRMYEELGLTVETITVEENDDLEKAVDHILKKYKK